MDGKKVFLAVLILLALLFAVGLVLGAARSERPPDDPEREPSGFEKTLGGLVGSMKPRARLAAKEFACGTSTSAPAADQALRTLKLRIGKGCRVKIVYQRPPRPDPSKMDRQAWPPEEGKIKDPESTTFVILKEGGTLTFGACAAGGHAGCKVVVVED